MLKTILSALKSGMGSDKDDQRRRYPRRQVDSCVLEMGGRMYPVENWSMGGVLVTADERMFGLNQGIDMTLKFKVRNKIVDVAHHGHVVRKNAQKIAIEFEPVNRAIRQTFQSIIDDYTAQQFANSQA